VAQGERIPGRARSLATLAAVLTTLSLAAPAASALATDRFVDDQGLGDFPCTNPLDPCATIGTALNVPSVPGDVIHVGGGSYPGNLTLPDGVSLIKNSFASGAGITTTGAATINTMASTTPAITLATGTSPRVISGFTLRGGNIIAVSAALIVPAPSDNVTISQNTFDDHSINVLRQLRVTSGSPHITGNTFVGANDGTARGAIDYATSTGGSPEIDHNTIDGLFQGIRVSSSGSPRTFDIHDNAITNVYDEPSNAIPIAVAISGASGKLMGNLATEIPGQELGEGIDVITGPANGTGIAVEASHNQVYGFSGFSEFGTPDPVVLTDDAFSAADGAALGFFDVAGGATVRNVTAIGGGAGTSDIFLSSSPTTIDSTVIGSRGIAIVASTCTSSFSVGTAASPGCGLSTIADPLFANASANDVHLLAGSSLIDAGNPAAPAAGDTDLDGNPRAIAVVSCPARRDIGAYELNNPRDCVPPDTIPPDTTVSGKRKVRTRKKKARVTFTFTSSEPGSTFACSLDGRPFAPCSSPFTVKLRRGAHTLSVRATDTTGNADTTPASFTTKVKRKRNR
jgi:hypothetical protein